MMTYFVRSADGADYRVGTWRDGEWFPGSLDDAIRERNMLAEPGAYVWGRGR